MERVLDAVTNVGWVLYGLLLGTSKTLLTGTIDKGGDGIAWRLEVPSVHSSEWMDLRKGLLSGTVHGDTGRIPTCMYKIGVASHSQYTQHQPIYHIF